MNRVTRLALAGLAVASLLAACGGGDDDDDGGASDPGVVRVVDNKFEPKQLEVGVGDTVTWRFEGKSAHNVTFDDVKSDLTKDGEFEHTFDEAGDFDYVCTVHPGMTGTVRVSDSAVP
jgi:plastocyanin